MLHCPGVSSTAFLPVQASRDRRTPAMDVLVFDAQRLLIVAGVGPHSRESARNTVSRHAETAAKVSLASPPEGVTVACKE